MAEQAPAMHICARCHRPIEPPDTPVKLAKQHDVTGFNPSGMREWADGLISFFHDWHAPRSQVGVWRRVHDEEG